jgi:hypothetical protein
MTQYLWTGESILRNRKSSQKNLTLQWPISLTERPVVICKGAAKCAFGSSSRRFLSGCRQVLFISGCHCDEFMPYRIVGKEDEEEIEKQIPEVIE